VERVTKACLLALAFLSLTKMWSKSKFESSFRVPMGEKIERKNHEMSMFEFPCVAKNERNIALHISVITRFRLIFQLMMTTLAS
jgi:hypothetical protein